MKQKLISQRKGKIRQSKREQKTARDYSLPRQWWRGKLSDRARSEDADDDRAWRRDL
jgi:hypothetical protein